MSIDWSMSERVLELPVLEQWRGPLGKVEDGQVAWGLWPTPRFPSPARQTGRADSAPAFRLASPQGTRRPAAHCWCRATTRFPNSASGACFAGPHSPWSLPFAPLAPLRRALPQLAPQKALPLCSPASSLLWRSPTSQVRSSSATAPRLPDAGPSLSRDADGQTRDLPASDAILLHGCGLRSRQGDSTSHSGAAHVAFERIETLGPCNI